VLQRFSKRGAHKLARFSLQCHDSDKSAKATCMSNKGELKSKENLDNFCVPEPEYCEPPLVIEGSWEFIKTRKNGDKVFEVIYQANLKYNRKCNRNKTFLSSTAQTLISTCAEKLSAKKQLELSETDITLRMNFSISVHQIAHQETALEVARAKDPEKALEICKKLSCLINTNFY